MARAKREKTGFDYGDLIFPNMITLFALFFAGSHAEGAGRIIAMVGLAFFGAIFSVIILYLSTLVEQPQNTPNE